MYKITKGYKLLMAWTGSSTKSYSPEAWWNACLIHTCEDKSKKKCSKLPVRDPDGSYSKSGLESAYRMVGHVKGISPEEKNSIQEKISNILKKEFGEEKKINSSQDTIQVEGILLTTGNFDAMSGKLTVDSDCIQKTYNNLQYPISVGVTHSDDSILSNLELDKVAMIKECYLSADKNKILFNEVLINKEYENIWNSLIINDDIGISINGTVPSDDQVWEDGELKPKSISIPRVDLVDKPACQSCKINFMEAELMAEENNMSPELVALQKSNDELKAKLDSLNKQYVELEKKHNDYVEAEHKLELSHLASELTDTIREEVKLEQFVDRLINKGVILSKDKELHLAKGKSMGLKEYDSFMKTVAPAVDLGRVSYRKDVGIRDMVKSHSREEQELIDQYKLNLAMGRTPPLDNLSPSIKAELGLNEEEE